MTTLERVGVAPLVEKMVETRLRWYGHVERRHVDSMARRVGQMEGGRGFQSLEVEEEIEKL